MAARHRHKFQRLSDTALFCECGQTKYVTEPACNRAHLYPTWIAPYVTTPYWPTWAPTITTGGTTSPFPAGTTVTYTADAPTIFPLDGVTIENIPAD